MFADRSLPLIVLTLLLSSCATIDEFPVLDDAETNYLVVAGHFIGARYLPYPPECSSGEYICLDAPPMALRFAVDATLYGSRPPMQLVTFTTRHAGKEGLDFGPEHPYLLLLKTDGRHFVTPRYSFKRLGWDVRDRAALPLKTAHRPIRWLPCDVNHLVQEIRFQHSESGIREGLFLDDIKRALSNQSEAQIAAGRTT
ncbi:MAG: hypothetical protein AAGL69_02690 [Pseudomonadota bacterium]